MTQQAISQLKVPFKEKDEAKIIRRAVGTQMV